MDRGLDAHGRMGVDRLPELFRGRRLRYDEVVTRVRERAGVELVPGFERLVGGTGIEAYGGRGPIASTTHLTDAHLIRLVEGSELVWETAEVPSNLGGRQVAFPFPMAMGNGSPLPQPGGNFVLHLDDRRLLRFTLTKDPQTWEAGGCRLRFDVRRVDATAFRQRLTLDAQLDAASVLWTGSRSCVWHQSYSARGVQLASVSWPRAAGDRPAGSASGSRSYRW